MEIKGAFGNTPYLLPVKLVVSASTVPLLRVSQNQLNFAYQTGSSTTTLNQTVDVSSTGNPLPFLAQAAASGTGWLAVTPTTQQNTSAPITVSVTPGSLPPGVYSSQVAVQTPEANATPIIIPVHMVISTQPLLNVTPSSLLFNTTELALTPQTIAVGSTGNQFAYQATSSIAGGGNWLVIAQSGPNTGSTVEVGVNPTVAEGSGLITITAPGIDNSPFYVPVTLANASPASQLTVTPSLLDFIQVIGSPAPPAQILDVTLGQSGGISSYKLGDIRYTNGTNWLKVNKTAGIAPDKVEVSIDASGLVAGHYAATIPFTSDAGNRDVVVFLDVRRVTSVFTVAPETLTFNFSPGGATPASQQITVGSTGEPIAYTASATVAAGVAPWLILNASSGTTPSVLTVSVNPGTLAAGIYQGTINLVGGGGAVTRSIPVTLNIASVPTPVITRMVNGRASPTCRRSPA